MSEVAHPPFASFLDFGLAGPAVGEPGYGSLDRVYTAYCVTVGILKSELGAVPIETSARFAFTQQLVTQAWYCLAQEARAVGPRQYALVGLLVPDLVFARVDHVPPAAFAGYIDAQTLATWHSILDLLVDHSMKPVMKLPAAGRIVMDRLKSEAHLHRPFSEIFAEAADAR